MELASPSPRIMTPFHTWTRRPRFGHFRCVLPFSPDSNIRIGERADHFSSEKKKTRVVLYFKSGSTNSWTELKTQKWLISRASQLALLLRTSSVRQMAGNSKCVIARLEKRHSLLVQSMTILPNYPLKKPEYTRCEKVFPLLLDHDILKWQSLFSKLRVFPFD